MKIGIFGLGTLGSHFADIAVGLFRNQYEWVLIDCDQVEVRNVGIQVYETKNINRQKTEAISVELYHRYNVTNFDIFNQKIVSVNQLLNFDLDLLIEMVDNREAIEITLELGIPVLHLKFSIFQNNPTGLVQWDNVFQLPDIELAEDPCEIASIRPFAILTAAQGILALQKYLVDNKVKESFIVSVNGIRKIE